MTIKWIRVLSGFLAFLGGVYLIFNGANELVIKLVSVASLAFVISNFLKVKE